jgi:hypothetical protein
MSEYNYISPPMVKLGGFVTVLNYLFVRGSIFFLHESVDQL